MRLIARSFHSLFFFGEAKEKVVGLERKNSDGNVLSLGDVVVEVEDEKIGDRLEEGGRGVLNRTANGPFCHQGNDHYTHTHWEKAFAPCGIRFTTPLDSSLLPGKGGKWCSFLGGCRPLFPHF